MFSNVLSDLKRLNLAHVFVLFFLGGGGGGRWGCFCFPHRGLEEDFFGTVIQSQPADHTKKNNKKKIINIISIVAFVVVNITAIVVVVVVVIIIVITNIVIIITMIDFFFIFLLLCLLLFLFFPRPVCRIHTITGFFLLHTKGLGSILLKQEAGEHGPPMPPDPASGPTLMTYPHLFPFLKVTRDQDGPLVVHSVPPLPEGMTYGPQQ